MQSMILIQRPNTQVGVGDLQYTIPETLGDVRLKLVNASLASVAVGSLDINLQVRDSGLNLKAQYSAPNVGAGHSATSICTFGGTGAYYLATQGGLDIHHIPMQELILKGGDIIFLHGLVTAAGNWQNINVWLEAENDFL